MSANKRNIPSFRLQVSVLLLAFAALALVLPDRNHRASELSPEEMISFLNSSDYVFSVDQVARIVVNDVQTFQLIDLRSEKEYLDANIPGSINIPFEEILNSDWSGYLDDENKNPILYSNGTARSAEAVMLCTQFGYQNVKMMQGGMNEWFKLVMESEFGGEKISAAENARYGMRFKAREYFNTMNSLPDSLKIAFLEVKKKKDAELVGGCD